MVLFKTIIKLTTGRDLIKIHPVRRFEARRFQVLHEYF